MINYVKWLESCEEDMYSHSACKYAKKCGSSNLCIKACEVCTDPKSACLGR